MRNALPRMGNPGSRSSSLHDSSGVGTGAGEASISEKKLLFLLRWLGAVGALLMGLGGLGGGALPVVDNPWFGLPGGALMGRMMLASSSVVLVGVGLMVAAWLMMAPLIGVGRSPARVPARVMVGTFIAWTAPLLITAPLFTQDIYSYLAQGSIVRQGIDPYSAGPVELLGAEHHLARSVPFIWAESPSPYGPVALGIAAGISALTNDDIFAGVLTHRAISFFFVLIAAWATVALAKRCNVHPTTALWLGVCNPLTILHLIGGIHNEAIMAAFMLVGLEVAFRGLERLDRHGLGDAAGWALFVLSGALLTCGGLVKVTGFVALGFTGMALARVLRARMNSRMNSRRGMRGRARALVAAAIAAAVGLQAAVLAATAVVSSWVSGIGFGWVTGQGGAAEIRSWMSVTTDIGIAASQMAMRLGLGDHSDAMLLVTRGAGLLVAGAFMIRMLWATFTGGIHPIGGLGVSMLVLVALFPVVHPWYPLWALLPLAAWANRPAFRTAVAVISATFCFLVLSRGLALPPDAVATIYTTAAACFSVLALCVWIWWQRRGRLALR
ncbi:hypothetical protein CGLAU_06645 [Corynebacterium glaucum]|uniref:Alpha-(1->6)-mannopyranosyltransferase A n=2 Tax=Corynebacterium glaucum TaxID=187491 RepID=A0A1Q2HWR3_9CORY|nr:hypothetical protein CGLAU_06645 [Corynebacterium glaucum]